MPSDEPLRPYNWRPKSLAKLKKKKNSTISIHCNVKSRFIGVKISQLAEKKKGTSPFSNSVTSQSHIHRHRGGVRCRFPDCYQHYLSQAVNFSEEI